MSDEHPDWPIFTAGLPSREAAVVLLPPLNEDEQEDLAITLEEDFDDVPTLILISPSAPILTDELGDADAVATLTAQKEKLEGLCRALQAAKKVEGMDVAEKENAVSR